MDLHKKIISGILLIGLVIANHSFAQCNKTVTLGESFDIKLPKKMTFKPHADSTSSAMEYFLGYIQYKNDSVRVFEAKELYIQATLAINQEIFDLTSADQFQPDSETIKELQEIRNVSFIVKEDYLIVIDLGPKSAKGSVPIEVFCYDFVSRRSLVINSSSTVDDWNKNLQLISSKFASKLSQSLSKVY